MEEQKSEKQDEEESFYDCEETLETTTTALHTLQLGEETRREETRREEAGEETRREETQQKMEERLETTTALHTVQPTEETRKEETREEEARGEETRTEEMREEARSEEKKQEEEEREEESHTEEELRDRLRATDERTGGEEEEPVVEGAESEARQEAEFPPEPLQEDEEEQRELEKELSPEERESRRQQSLSLKDKGNQLFKSQRWASAESVYSEALSVCPLTFTCERAVLFSNRGAARVHLGEKDKAIADCTKAVELNPDYLKALLRRAELYEQTDKLDEALEDYQKVLERDPGNSTARGGAVRLPPLIQQRNEKLKQEMMTSLKNLGNMILRPFGLSTNNFELNQDQTTGAYNINFVQTPR